VGARRRRVAPYYAAIADAMKRFEQHADRNVRTSEDSGDEGLLRNLLLPSLDPCAQRGGRAETDVD
jgi:hypothetical protein